MANFLIGGIQGSIKAFQGDFGPLLKTRLLIILKIIE